MTGGGGVLSVYLPLRAAHVLCNYDSCLDFFSTKIKKSLTYSYIQYMYVQKHQLRTTCVKFNKSVKSKSIVVN